MPQNRLAHQLRAVRPLGAHILMLHLIELAMHKGVDFGPSRPAHPLYGAGLFRRFLFCQLFMGLVQLFAPLFHAELGCRRLFLLAFLPEFGF